MTWKCISMYNFEYLHTFVFICIITLGSARSQKIFLDNQSETCQKSSSSKKSTDLRRNVQFSKITIFCLKLHENVYLRTIFEYFYTFMFIGIITLGSARSQKNFLDKQSETCQKSSSSKKSTDLRRNVQFSKSQWIQSKMAWNHTLYVQFSSIFMILCFFVLSHWALRDLRKIFLTNNLRFVRKVPAPRNLQIWEGM